MREDSDAPVKIGVPDLTYVGRAEEAVRLRKLRSNVYRGDSWRRTEHTERYGASARKSVQLIHIVPFEMPPVDVEPQTGQETEINTNYETGGRKNIGVADNRDSFTRYLEEDLGLKDNIEFDGGKIEKFVENEEKKATERYLNEKGKNGTHESAADRRRKAIRYGVPRELYDELEDSGLFGEEITAESVDEALRGYFIKDIISRLKRGEIDIEDLQGIKKELQRCLDGKSELLTPEDVIDMSLLDILKTVLLMKDWIL